MPTLQQRLADSADPRTRRQAMQAAAGIVKQMDPDDMMKVMEAQAGGMGGMPPGLGGGAGLFDGAGASSSALDELSEDLSSATDDDSADLPRTRCESPVPSWRSMLRNPR